MFILTTRRIMFVRDDSSKGAEKCGKVPIQIYERSQVSNVKRSGGILALKTVTFCVVDGEEKKEVKWERILGDNADFIVEELVGK